MKHKQHGSLVPWVDVFANLALAFCLCFILAFISITDKLKQNEAGVQPKADFLITLEWNPKSDADIDLWVKDPDGKIVGFPNKSIGGVFLDRDDMGGNVDTITRADGTSMKIEINQEVMTIRGFKKGRYTVAAHYYRGREPEKLDISVLKLQPFGYVYKKTGIPIEQAGQEVTLLSFEIDHNGNVVSLNTNPNFFVNRGK